MSADRWMVCSACRRDIRFGAKHYVCSVSTCNRPATRLVFCSVPCWDTHVVVLRHRDAWAVEALAPDRGAGLPAPTPPAPSQPPPPVARTVEAARPVTLAPPVAAPAVPSGITLQKADETEILVVVSKVKKYIKERSGMNTSDAVTDVLSAYVRAICDGAIRVAAKDGRKTVMDRDFPPIRKP
jgi:histone H3/H4